IPRSATGPIACLCEIQRGIFHGRSAGYRADPRHAELLNSFCVHRFGDRDELSWNDRLLTSGNRALSKALSFSKEMSLSFVDKFTSSGIPILFDFESEDIMSASGLNKRRPEVWLNVVVATLLAASACLGAAFFKASASERHSMAVSFQPNYGGEASFMAENAS